jgi:pyruvate dehydrogenase E2 component (dihydrolipoamide acetyltransferase)
VAVEGGLLTPVIAHAGELSLFEISRETKHLIEGAKSGHLLESETLDATITVSNLGAFGVESFQAIINPPQGAILAVGAAQKDPSSCAKLMRATLSVDHRITDGVQAAKFLGEFKRLLEKPLELLIEGRR